MSSVHSGVKTLPPVINSGTSENIILLNVVLLIGRGTNKSCPGCSSVPESFPQLVTGYFYFIVCIVAWCTFWFSSLVSCSKLQVIIIKKVICLPKRAGVIFLLCGLGQVRVANVLLRCSNSFLSSVEGMILRAIHQVKQHLCKLCESL